MYAMKSMLSILAIILCLAVASPISAGVRVNGKKIEGSVKIKVVNGRTLVPVRVIAEELGANISYSIEKKEVYIVKDNKSIVLMVDSKKAMINNKEVILDEMTIQEYGVTLVPLRFIGETLGCTIEYDPEIYFDGKKLSCSGDVLKEYYEDINNDQIKDHITIVGDESDWENNKVIYFYDGKTGKLLTSIIGGSWILYIEEDSFKDITGDGVKEFILCTHSGAGAGGFYDVFTYKDGTYKKIEYHNETSIGCELVDGFKCIMKDSGSGKKVIKNFNQAQKESLLKYSSYNASGKVLDGGYCRDGAAYIKDINGDGRLEYVVSNWMDNLHADFSVHPTVVYSYYNGKLKIIDMYIEIK